MNSFEMTREFHKVMELPVHDSPREPSVEERILRAKLLLEETLETIEKGLGVGVDMIGDEHGHFMIQVCGITGPYDPVETLDGLADVKVIANGIAIQFGLPMEAADREVFESNMSKLDEDGRPIVNQQWECTTCNGTGVEYMGHEYQPESCRSCDGKTFVMIDPTQPVGKILKGPNFRKPDIKGILEAHCTGHVAASHDAKVCGNCGTHINELRPEAHFDMADISDEAKLDHCPNHPNATATGGYGLAGGGVGAYMICDECGTVFGKTEDSGE